MGRHCGVVLWNEQMGCLLYGFVCFSLCFCDHPFNVSHTYTCFLCLCGTNCIEVLACVSSNLSFVPVVMLANTMNSFASVSTFLDLRIEFFFDACTKLSFIQNLSGERSILVLAVNPGTRSLSFQALVCVRILLVSQ